MLSRYIRVAILSRAADAGAEPAVLLCAAAAGMSTGDGALVLGALTAAAAIGGPFAGALADRDSRMYAAGLLALGSGAIALAAGVGRLPLPVLLAVALPAGLAQPLFSGGWTAVLTAIVPAEERQRAYALDAMTYDLGAIGGPALASAAVVLGHRAPLAATGVLALAAVPTALRTRWPQPGRSGEPTSVRAGLGVLARNRPLRTVTVVSTLQYAGMAARTVAAPALAQQITGHTAFAGLLFAASAGASLSGSALLTRIRLPWAPARVALGCTVLSAGALAGLAGTPAPWLAAALFAACGLLDAPLLTSVFAIRSEHSPAGLRAQVFATAASIKTTAYAAAIMLFGIALQAGLSTCLLLGALVQIAGLACAVPQGVPAPVGRRARD